MALRSGALCILVPSDPCTNRGGIRQITGECLTPPRNPIAGSSRPADDHISSNSSVIQQWGDIKGFSVQGADSTGISQQEQGGTVWERVVEEFVPAIEDYTRIHDQYPSNLKVPGRRLHDQLEREQSKKGGRGCWGGLLRKERSQKDTE